MKFVKFRNWLMKRYAARSAGTRLRNGLAARWRGHCGRSDEQQHTHGAEPSCRSHLTS
jgi:hypothetical protein